MNQTKQTWALFKFQFVSNPIVFAAPIIFLMPLAMEWIQTGSDPTLDFLLMGNSTFLYSILILMTLMPEIFQRGNTSYATGIELLLTRAVDRSLVYRSKIFFLFLIILLLPVVLLFRSALHPDLQIFEYSKFKQGCYLAALPGSTISTESKYEDIISIPRGNILVKEWQLWIPLALLTGIQLLVALLYPFKYRGPLLVVAYIGLACLPLLNAFPFIHDIKNERPQTNVELFLFFASHQFLFWVVTVVVFVSTQLWCERRFCRFEF